MCPRSRATYSPVLASIPSSPVLGSSGRSPFASGLSSASAKADAAASLFSHYHAQEAAQLAALERRLWLSSAVSLSLFALLACAHFRPALLAAALFVPPHAVPSGPWAAFLRLLVSFAAYLSLLEAFAYGCTRIARLSSPRAPGSAAHATSPLKALAIQACALLTAAALTNLPALALAGYSLQLKVLAFGLTTVVGGLLVWDAVKGEQLDDATRELEDEEFCAGGFVGVEFRKAESWDEC